MSSRDIRTVFDGRRAEVDAYLDLIRTIEAATRNGPPAIGDQGASISPLQQRILYANVFVQLYNLVEATITRCLEELQAAACATGVGRTPADLASPILREWVRFSARTHTDMAYEKRLEAALRMAEHLIGGLPIAELKVEAGGGGNWDDVAIERIAGRVGCDLAMAGNVKTAAKRHVRDDLGALALVKDLRNRLAHGSMSFGECGASVTVSNLEAVATPVLEYLDAVVESFVQYLDGERFLASTSTVGASP